MARAPLEGLARNAAIVLGNRSEPAALAALARAAESHPSATVRDAASWAARRIGAREGGEERGADRENTSDPEDVEGLRAPR